MIVGTAGHIDHGKTSLVKALTGVDADRLPEEKARGITLDLGYAYLPLPRGEVLGFVDMPGHEKLVHNMLAGATGIDFVLLVVAADDGPMPQTREHLEILDLLGLNRGAVALTKTDLTDAARIAEVTTRITALLKGTALENSPVLPVSSVTGEGMTALRRLLEQQAARLPPRLFNGRFRLAVDRCFTLAGTGTVVTGTAHAGTVRPGDRLTLSPAGVEVRVRGMHVQNRAAEEGGAGQRCALNLAGVDKAAIGRGDWVLESGLHHPVQRFAVRLRLLEQEEKPLKHWTPVHLHLGATDTTGRVSLLEGDSLAPGDEEWAELALDRPVGALGGDRFVIRDQSARRTLGGGTVVDIFPPTRGKRAPAYLARLSALAEPSTENALIRLLAQQPVDLEQFALMRNLTAPEAATLYRIAPLVEVPTAAGRQGFHRDTWQSLQQAAVDALATYHREHPDEAGASREALRRLAAPSLDRAAWGALLDALLAEIKIARSGFLLHMPEHRVALSPAERVQWEKTLPLLLEVPFAPPRVRDIARVRGDEEVRVRSLLHKAERLGETFQVAHDHFFTPQAVEKLAAIVAELEREHGEARAAEFRNRIGTGRKLAIQILEFFDRIGYTRRAAESHRLRADGWQLFGSEKPEPGR